MAALPAWAGSWAYDNGPINGNVDGWTINFGFTVSDSYVAAGTSVNGFEFGAHEFPEDTLSSLGWILSTGPCSGSGCGTIVGSGTATGSNLTDQFLFVNEFGFDVDLITVSNLNVTQINGQGYWLTLENAATPSGDPAYWDENSGVGCQSQGCPRVHLRIRWAAFLPKRSPSVAAQVELLRSPAASCSSARAW